MVTIIVRLFTLDNYNYYSIVSFDQPQSPAIPLSIWAPTIVIVPLISWIRVKCILTQSTSPICRVIIVISSSSGVSTSPLFICKIYYWSIVPILNKFSSTPCVVEWYSGPPIVIVSTYVMHAPPLIILCVPYRGTCHCIIFDLLLL